MLSAELKGKLPGGIRNLEDVLTSYVFNFLQYSTRTVFLKGFLQGIGIDASDTELRAAEFRFWPVFPDGTEPDLVMVVGGYYLLVEAKLFASFDPGDSCRQPQVVREIDGGMEEAGSEGKQFSYVAITADSCFPRKTFACHPRHRDAVRWVNWQRISRLILGLLEDHREILPDRTYATDLLAILDARNLRGYRGFDVIKDADVDPPAESIFLQSEKLAYRGDFIGFLDALGGLKSTEPPASPLFLSRQLFRNLAGPAPAPERIFFSGS